MLSVHHLEQCSSDLPAGNHTHRVSTLEGVHHLMGSHTSYHQRAPACLFPHKWLWQQACSPQSPKLGYHLNALTGCIKLLLWRGVSCNLAMFCPSITHQYQPTSAVKDKRFQNVNAGRINSLLQDSKHPKAHTEYGQMHQFWCHCMAVWCPENFNAEGTACHDQWAIGKQEYIFCAHT